MNHPINPLYTTNELPSRINAIIKETERPSEALKPPTLTLMQTIEAKARIVQIEMISFPKAFSRARTVNCHCFQAENSHASIENEQLTCR